jgi:hypothetical protein
MFVKDRQHEKNSRRQQIIYRMQADAVVGDENLYKIEYVSPLCKVVPICSLATKCMCSCQYIYRRVS